MTDLLTLVMSISDDLLGWFVETTLVASALAILAALAARVPRLAPSPAARHALWLIVLIKMVTPPLVHWPWSVPSPVTMTSHESVTRPVETESTVILELATTPDAASPDSPDREIEPMTASSTLEDSRIEISQLESFPAFRALSQSPGVCVVIAWLVGSIGLGLVQVRGIIRFRRLLLDATPAPSWLSEEAEWVGRHLSVRVPPIQVVPGLGTPVLWCLGRPMLLVPAKLVQTLEAERWGAIVAHELAHLRRGDHWVRRLELLAGLVWWWNPLYWLVRNRLDFEAELACDAWAVWASPRDRISYAESLLRICTTLSSDVSPSPALGIIGTGRSFERRLTMILRTQVDRRISAPSLLVGSLLAVLALPSWTMAEDPVVIREVQGTVVVSPDGPDSIKVGEPVRRVVVVAIPKADDASDDGDDDDEKEKKDKDKKEKQSIKLKLTVQRDELTKQLEALTKELEAKFGPGSEFAKEIEKELGPNSEFAKQMKAFETEMKTKFGPDSVFVKKMEGLGKLQDLKVGPDSEMIIKKLKEEFAKDDPKATEPDAAKRVRARVEIRSRLDADSARISAEKAREIAAKAREEAEKHRATAEKAREDVVRLRKKIQVDAQALAAPATDKRAKRIEALAAPATDKRAKRIEALESLIEELMDEVKQLKAESAPAKEEGATPLRP